MRPAYYDRAPLVKSIIDSIQGVAPHALIARATYTVPAGRKALVTSAAAYMMRVTVAAPVGVFDCDVTRAGLGLVRMTSAMNAVNVPMALSVEAGEFVAAGETVNVRDEDLSTGGTVDYTKVANIVEFDA